MNFTQIIINGYTDRNNSKDLSGYLLREFKKAERDEFYEVNTFFDGCFNVVGILKRQLDIEFRSQKAEINKYRNLYEDYTMEFSEDSLLSNKERCDIVINEMDVQTAALDFNLVTFDLKSLLGAISVSCKLRNSDVEVIENAIQGAKDRALGKVTAESVFKTNLNDEQRKVLCDEIISNNGSKVGTKREDNRLFVDITEKHRPTLMYLLGGARPEKIVPIKFAVNSNIFLLLKSITNVDGTGKNKDEKVVPNFMTTKICPEILRDKNGNKFDKIKQ